MTLLPACMWITCMQGSKSPEEDVKTPKTRVADVISCRVVWKPNLGPLQEQVSAKAVKNLSSMYVVFKCKHKMIV